MNRRLSSDPASTSSDLLAWVGRAATAWLVLSFVAAFLLRQSWALVEGYALSGLDALFIAVSAVTGTGLSPENIGTTFTPAGRAVLLVAIQLGALVTMLLGARIVWSLLGRHGSFARVATRLIGAMLVLETIGAMALALLWRDGEVSQRLGWGVFDAVSAFCNAGFVAQRDGLAAYRYHVATQGVMAALMVAGSLAVPLWAVWKASLPASSLPEDGFALSVRSFAALYLAGVILFTLAALTPHFYTQLQLGNTPNAPDAGQLDGTALAGAAADASFLSVSARGGGFGTTPAESLPRATKAGLLGLMPFGGVPGGTSGGIFVLTLGVLLRSLWRGLRGTPDESPRAFQGAAIQLLTFFLLLVLAGVFLVSLFEPYPLSTVLFEVVAAASSTGIGMGITRLLTAFSESVIIVVMLLGRIGPMWILARMVAD